MAKQEQINIKVENALKRLNLAGIENLNHSPDGNNQKVEEKHGVRRDRKGSYTYINESGKEFNTLERVVNDIPTPIARIPKDGEVFGKDGTPDYTFIKEHFRREGRLTVDQMIRIIKLATDIMKKEDNLLRVDVPATIVGDIHGQYYDLLEMFDLCGDPKDVQFIFLGDYVDRGDRSIEVLILLYAMKINFPTRMWLLRGNHESVRMTEYFTFKKECEQRYNSQLYLTSIESFKALPLAAILNEQFFCVHAGISSSLWNVEEINEKIDRFRVDFPSRGLFCDLMWSDPSDEYDTEILGDSDEDMMKYFTFNNQRHCSQFYSYKAVETFLHENDLLCVIRGHQPQDAGYRMYKVNEATGFPSLITIFSAPNYCGTYDNMAAALVYNGETFNIRQFDRNTKAPYFLPDQMNLFEWSLPFVAEKVVQILSAVLNICSETELKNEEILLNKKNMDMIKSLDQAHKGIVSERDEQEEQEEQVEQEEEEEQITDAVPFRDSIQKKLAMVGRMSRILALMREERESINELKSLNGGILPKQLLIDGREKLHHTLHGFQQARVVDMENEGLPPATPRHAAGDDDTDTDRDEAPEPEADTTGADDTGHWDHFLFEWARRRKWGLGSGSADK